MKVMLLFPPKGFTSKDPLPSLGLLYIASVLEKEGIPVEVVDASLERYSWRALRTRYLRSRPDILGITTLTEFCFEAYKAGQLAKDVLPDCKVVVGGPHSSFCPDDILTHVPSLDIVLRGEGEYAFLELCNALDSGKDLSEILGVSYRDNGRIIHNPPSPLIKDLDQLPFPARHLLPIEKYNFRLFVPQKGLLAATHMMTSRGCPFGCSFCITTQLLGRTWRARSAENVIREVEDIVENFKINTIWFYDDVFTMSKKRTMEICDLILKRRLDINFTCSIRVDTVDKEILTKMKEAGCFKVFFGVESGSQRILDQVCGKKITIEQVRRLSRWLDELGIIKNPGYIISFPEETHQDASKTMELIKEIGGEVSLSFLRIYPGTKIEDVAKQKGILSQNFSWSRRQDRRGLSLPAAHGSAPIFMDKLSWDEISQITAEWAQIRRVSVWRRIPGVIKGMKSWSDVVRLVSLGRRYLIQKAKGLFKKTD